ncbi:MAG: dsDNA nuclease domain-containing protein [Cyanobacteria bacterium J06621_8]
MGATTEQGTNTSSKELDALFKTRWHGAVNIRGIRYQILYSVLRAFDLYKKEGKESFLRLEGIEDVDVLGLVGLRYKNEYIQVKSADKPWSWSKLKAPIKGFIEVSRKDSDCHFVLAVSFSLTKDIQKLAKLDSLLEKEQNRLKKSFRKLCKEVGGTSEEADDILARLSIVSLSEDKIWQLLRIKITEAFNLGSNAVNTYIAALVAQFLEWAKERETIGHSDLENIRADIGESLARETEFQAYGRSLVDRVSWASDQKLTDFFEGKGTRAGHIVANIDIKRPDWLEKIDIALNTSKVCILRASSGQGKSTLMYQYAYERWSRENVFILRVAKSPENVEVIRSYLQFRVNLGLPVLLLIDNVGWSTQLWSSIAQECAALGIRVLITVRDEDWQRFAQESLTSYEIIEPNLSIEEAKQIYSLLRKEGRIDPSVDSPEWAYERIGESKLLMEYVYLLTQGRMLEERLKDQIKQMFQQDEDPAKVEILRRTVLADALGTPLFVDKLLTGISFKGDPQQVLQSLCGEYLKIEGDLITGLHWVRSNCLAEILHQDYPNPATTSLAILEAIPSANLSTFVSNAICREGLNIETFFSGLVDVCNNVDLKTILLFLDGIFEAGERKFFTHNQSLFDEVYKSQGTSGIFWLGMDLLPIVSASNDLSNLIESLGDNGQHLREIKAIASKIDRSSRGLDLCNNFLSRVKSSLKEETLVANLRDTGRLLDWLTLCELSIPAWQDIRDKFFLDETLFSLSLDDFCYLAQGVYRYDESTYCKWFSVNKENIIGYLKLHTKCIDLKIIDETQSLYIEFFVDDESGISPNKQAVSRLDTLRTALPFLNRYQSQGIWFLSSNLNPSNDDTNKNIPKGNLSLKTDIDKNLVWRKIAQLQYLPDSYYHYEKGWNDLRRYALTFAKNFASELKKALTGKEDNPGRIYGKHLEGLQEIEEYFKFAYSSSIKSIDSPEISIPEPLKVIMRENIPGKWLVSFRNFHTQYFKYHLSGFKDKRLGKLALFNLNDAIKHLYQMHLSFSQLFLNAPDYFNVSELDAKEVKKYKELFDLLELLILERPGFTPENIIKYIEDNKDSKRNTLLNRFNEVLTPLKMSNISLVLPDDVYIDYPHRCLSLAFSVEDPSHITELSVILETIAKDREIVEYFYLIPIYQNKRCFEGGYKISSRELLQIQNDTLQSWETFALREIPQGALECLPPLPFEIPLQHEVKSIMSGFIFSFQIIVKYEKYIEHIEIAENTFELELYRYYKEKIKALHLKLETGIENFKKDLKDELSETDYGTYGIDILNKINITKSFLAI